MMDEVEIVKAMRSPLAVCLVSRSTSLHPRELFESIVGTNVTVTSWNQLRILHRRGLPAEKGKRERQKGAERQETSTSTGPAVERETPTERWPSSRASSTRSERRRVAQSERPRLPVRVRSPKDSVAV